LVQASRAFRGVGVVVFRCETMVDGRRPERLFGAGFPIG